MKNTSQGLNNHEPRFVWDDVAGAIVGMIRVGQVKLLVRGMISLTLSPTVDHPHGGVRPFNQKATCLPQLFYGLLWWKLGHSTLKSEATKSTVWRAPTALDLKSEK